MIISMLYQLGAVQYKGSLYGQYSSQYICRNFHHLKTLGFDMTRIPGE